MTLFSLHPNPEIPSPQTTHIQLPMPMFQVSHSRFLRELLLQILTTAPEATRMKCETSTKDKAYENVSRGVQQATWNWVWWHYTFKSIAEIFAILLKIYIGWQSQCPHPLCLPLANKKIVQTRTLLRVLNPAHDSQSESAWNGQI